MRPLGVASKKDIGARISALNMACTEEEQINKKPAAVSNTQSYGLSQKDTRRRTIRGDGHHEQFRHESTHHTLETKPSEIMGNSYIVDVAGGSCGEEDDDQHTRQEEGGGKTSQRGVYFDVIRRVEGMK